MEKKEVAQPLEPTETPHVVVGPVSRSLSHSFLSL
jgi:hypothetical protein